MMAAKILKHVRFYIIWGAVYVIITTPLAAQDTLLPSGFIKPFSIPDSITVFNSFQGAVPVGDINGDGLCDFTFSNYSNGIYRGSYLVTDINHPEKAVFIESLRIQGIGDYNGDGYDDMIGGSNWLIYLGNATAADFDTLQVPHYYTDYKVRYHADLNDDGKEEFVYVREYRSDTIFVMSYGYTSPKRVNYNVYYASDIIMFDYNTPDSNDQKKLFVCGYSFVNDRYDYGWFAYDSLSDMYQPVVPLMYRNTLHEPYSSFTSGLCDLNGDGRIDITHDFHDTEIGFQLEVYFGNDDAPFYFDHPVIIEASNNNRLLYLAGDINNDGCADWYSKKEADTVVVYYGSPDIIEQEAFNRTFYGINDNLLLMPQSEFNNLYLASQPVLFDYDMDGSNDLMFDYWTFNNDGRYDTLGTAIVMGSELMDFNEPEVLGVKASESYFHDNFGKVIKNTGDINKDGYADWAILSSGTGILNIYYGGVPLNYTPDLTIMLPQYPMVTSYDMAFGDLNGDDWIDIVVSNSSSSNIRACDHLLDPFQTIYIFSGHNETSDTLFISDAMKIWEGFSTTTSFTVPFGRSLAIPGDYNADGFNDLITKNSLPRKALIYYGRENLADEPDEMITVYCSGFSTYFAEPITSCGDIDDDGYIDFALGDTPCGTGRSLLYMGGPDADIDYDMIIEESASEGTKFGSHTPVTEGDFNGDGYPDIVHWHKNSNSLLIYLGGPDFDNQADIFLNDTTIDYSPYIIGYVNDFSKKGRADILTANHPYMSDTDLLYMFYGSTEDKQQANMVFNSTFSSVSGIASGDFDRNGYIDVFTGHPQELVDGKVGAGLVQHYISPILTGIEENNINNPNSLILYPNPASSFLYAKLKAAANGNVTFTIMDINGRKLYKTAGKTNQMAKLNITPLPTGIYIITATTKNTTLTGKLVKR